MASKRSLSKSPSSPKINDHKYSSTSKSCKVCTDEARIINYGALSCQSCQTFFRGNGLRPKIVRPCQYDGECEVNMLTRTMCTACRLGKCFAVGMSADLIQEGISHTKKRSLSTESMKSQASKCKTIMPGLPLTTLDLLQNDRSSLTTSEWTLFSNVLHAYDTFSLIPRLNQILKVLSPSTGESHFSAADTLDIFSSIYTSMRLFLSSTPDFQVLSINEQQSLLERNLNCITSVCASIFFRDTHFLDNFQCCDSYIALYGLAMVKQTKYLINQLDPDSTLLKLMLIIIAFSSNSYLVDIHENICKDSLMFGTFRLYGSQNVYVEVLWKYMLYRYGYVSAVLRFDRLVKFVIDKIRQSTNIYTTNNTHHNFVNDAVAKTKQNIIINQNEPIILWGKTLTSY